MLTAPALCEMFTLRKNTEKEDAREISKRLLELGGVLKQLKSLSSQIFGTEGRASAAVLCLIKVEIQRHCQLPKGSRQKVHLTL